MTDKKTLEDRVSDLEKKLDEFVKHVTTHGQGL